MQTFVASEKISCKPINMPRGPIPREQTIAQNRLAPVVETIARFKQDLPRDTPLIGFCGAPWTVASYMIAGRGTPD